MPSTARPTVAQPVMRMTAAAGCRSRMRASSCSPSSPEVSSEKFISNKMSSGCPVASQSRASAGVATPWLAYPSFFSKRASEARTAKSSSMIRIIRFV